LEYAWSPVSYTVLREQTSQVHILHQIQGGISLNGEIKFSDQIGNGE